jgi:hypothetical protein
VETCKAVPDHILEYNDAIYGFLEISLVKQTAQKKITLLKAKVVFVLFCKTQFCKKNR